MLLQMLQMLQMSQKSQMPSVDTARKELLRALEGP
jgi:hypothetical protein